MRMRAIVLCDTVYSGAGRFLSDCHSEGMRVNKLGGFRYEISGVQVEFRRAEFPSIAGVRADILATDVEDREIEAYRLSVLAHSQLKESKNVRTLKDLMEFLKQNK